MMKRIFIAVAMLLGLTSMAFAETFSSPMVQTGWSYSSGTATGSNVRSMKMIMEMTDKPEGHWYDVTFTVSGYSGSGSVRAFVGQQMPAAPAGSWVDKSTITPIADNFDTSDGLESSPTEDMDSAPNSLTGPGLSIEDIGSFRIFCSHGWFGLIDPVLAHNQIGAGHIHEGIGNTEVRPDWNYSDFRTKGSSSCQDTTGTLAKHPWNRSGYWWPAIITEINGKLYLVKENQTLIYYKGPPRPGLNYQTAAHPRGGSASASGSTITRTAGQTFGGTSAFKTAGDKIYFGADNYNLVEYTITSVIDADHLTVSGSPPAISGLYSPAPSEIFLAAAHQCDDEWGRNPTMTTDQTGATVDDDSRCPQWPHGMKFIFGYNKANGQGRPDVPIDITSGDNGTGAVTSGTEGAIVWECWRGPDAGEDHASESASGGAIFHSLDEVVADVAANPSHCPVGSILHFSYGGPTCWDGHHIDSPDHRAHVAYGVRPTTSGYLGNQRCPAAVPYPMPQMGVQNFYTIDQSFRDGKWRLSVEEMVDGLCAGCGAHMDYVFAWSPTVSDLWFSNCVHPHNSCTNDIGDGTKIPGPLNWDRTGAFCNGCGHHRPDRYVPVENYGMSSDYTANGTYTVRLRSAGAPQWGFMGLHGFNGSVSAVTITEVPAAKAGPVTVGGMH